MPPYDDARGPLGPACPVPGVEGLVTHAIYQIATGKWAPGERLPSVRRAQTAWGVDKRIVQRAWRRLHELGLVDRVDRSGYYVARGPRLGRLARHRHELERIHRRFARELIEETGLAPTAAFRYLTHLADIAAHERPACAFVECTQAQASGHANEVFAELGVPCLPVLEDDVTPGLSRLPDHVRTVLVSAFHAADVRETVTATGREFVAVPIEVSGDLAERVPRTARSAVLLDDDETEARNILEDVRALRLPLDLRYELAADIDRGLEELLGSASDEELVLLAPRSWGNTKARWREHPRVLLVDFRVTRAAWPEIADAVGLPLGFLAPKGRGEALI